MRGVQSNEVEPSSIKDIRVNDEGTSRNTVVCKGFQLLFAIKGSFKCFFFSSTIRIAYRVTSSKNIDV